MRFRTEMAAKMSAGEKRPEHEQRCLQAAAVSVNHRSPVASAGTAGRLQYLRPLHFS
jgi:hypothetical protein